MKYFRHFFLLVFIVLVQVFAIRLDWKQMHEYSLFFRGQVPPVCPSSKVGTYGGPLRLLVAVAAARFAPGRLPYLNSVLKGYLGYSGNISVDILVDTADPTLAEILHDTYPPESLPKGKTIGTNIWTPEDLERQSLITGVKIDPVELAVTHSHRHYIHRRYVDYDYIVYTEDDIFMTETTFSLFASRNVELWGMGWILGFLRTEKNNQGEQCTPDNLEDQTEGGGTKEIVTLNGHLYRVPPNSYNGMWILDKNQVQTFVSDPTGIFLKGFWSHDERERMAFGYQHAFSPQKGWVSRTLIPLLSDFSVDERALIRHVPNNYCNKTSGKCARVREMGGLAGATPSPLKPHPLIIC